MEGVKRLQKVQVQATNKDRKTVQPHNLSKNAD